MGDVAERFWKVQARLGLVGLVRGEGCLKQGSDGITWL